MIAIMENYQQADGTVAVPEVLQEYMKSEGDRKVNRKSRHEITKPLALATSTYNPVDSYAGLLDNEFTMVNVCLRR